MVKSVVEAYILLDELNAPKQLIQHSQLVEKTANLIIEGLEDFDLNINQDLVLVGSVIHDIGKTIVTEELTNPGEKNSKIGQQLLINRGVSKEISRICYSHSHWNEIDCSLEELLVALADELWKGKRNEELEQKIINLIAEKLGKQYWDIFIDIDGLFETIGQKGSDNLLSTAQ